MSKKEADTISKPTPLALIFKEEIRLMDKLGEGAYAVVKHAKWMKSKETEISVAVKILHDITKDLEAEIRTMSKLQHPNLVELYGVVFGNPLLLVMEFCDDGSLLDRLRAIKKPVLLVTQLLNYALQIVSGMKYLEKKGYVHRDLATRNVLLKNNDEIVKLCDFGLSRVLSENDGIYEMKNRTKIPIAWCPPEALRFRRFSSASDVWSFGVTLWECFTYCEVPWIGLNALNVLETTERGERLYKPQKCPPNIYDLMLKCWSLDISHRPIFQEIYEFLAKTTLSICTSTENYKSSSSVEMPFNKGEKIIVIEEINVPSEHTNNITKQGSRRKFVDDAPLPVSVLKKFFKEETNSPSEDILRQAKEKLPKLLPPHKSPKIPERKTIKTVEDLVPPAPPPRRVFSTISESADNSPVSVKETVEEIKNSPTLTAMKTSVISYQQEKEILRKMLDTKKLQEQLNKKRVSNLYIDNEKASTTNHTIHGEAERESFKVGNDREDLDEKTLAKKQQDSRNQFWISIGLISVIVVCGALIGIACGAPIKICISIAVVASVSVIATFLSLAKLG